jgi:hypothetical protein
MPENDYTPAEALKVLMSKLRSRDQSLASRIQSAIDVGKDVSEITTSAKNRKKRREYRKTVPFTDEEALRVAVDALQAYFVEQPLFSRSISTNFTSAGIDVSTQTTVKRYQQARSTESADVKFVNEAKQIEFETQTETQISIETDTNIQLKQIESEMIEEQQRNIQQLRSLTNFEIGS